MHDTENFLSGNLKDLRHRLHHCEQRKIAIFGQPGAGKSSLLINITGKKLDRHPLVGIETDRTSWSSKDESPIFYRSDLYTFIDVPGYGTHRHPAGLFVDLFPFSLVDVYIFVVSGKLLLADEAVFHCINRSKKPFCVIRNFSENLNESDKNLANIDIRKKLSGQYPIFFSSNRSKRGLPKIYDWIHSHFGN